MAVRTKSGDGPAVRVCGQGVWDESSQVRSTGKFPVDGMEGQSTPCISSRKCNIAVQILTFSRNFLKGFYRGGGRTISCYAQI